MVFTMLEGTGLRGLKGWESSLLVDSENLPAFRHLRKPCGSARVRKENFWEVFPQSYWLWWFLHITQIFIWIHNTELKDEHKIFLGWIVQSSFLRKFTFQYEDFDRIQHVKDVQNQDKFNMGMHNRIVADVWWHLLVVVTLGYVSGVSTIWDSGHHSSSRVLPVPQEMSSKGGQRKHNLWENSERTGMLRSREAKTDERCDNNL